MCRPHRTEIPLPVSSEWCCVTAQLRCSRSHMKLHVRNPFLLCVQGTLHVSRGWFFLFDSGNFVPENFLLTCLLESSGARMSPKERTKENLSLDHLWYSYPWACLFYDVNVYVHMHMQMFLFPYMIIYFTYNSALVFLLTNDTPCCRTLVHGKIWTNISRWIIIGKGYEGAELSHHH